MDLHLTPTRRTLLQEVADGNVIRSTGSGSRLYDHYQPGYNLGIGRRLSGRIAEMEAAGWIELVEVKEAWHTRRTWRLTKVGRAVLEAAS